MDDAEIELRSGVGGPEVGVPALQQAQDLLSAEPPVERTLPGYGG